MTGSRNSTSQSLLIFILMCLSKKRHAPLGVVPTASTTAALAMGDAIAVALLVKRGLKQEDFAFFHPGGNLGKKLFIKVKDLMHTGDALPFVSPETEMTKAVMEISSKRLGVAIVSNKDKKILGVLTDGDIRRGIEKWGKDFFDMKAGEVMTKIRRRSTKTNLR